MTRFARRVRVGEPITAEWANAIADGLAALERMSVAPPLELSRGAAGYRLRLADWLKIELFELNEDLTAGGSAEASVLSYDGTDWLPADTQTIVVHDAVGSFDALSGSRGVTWFHRQSGLWLVMQLECL